MSRWFLCYTGAMNKKIQNTLKIKTRRRGALIDIDAWSRCYALHALSMMNSSMLRRLRRHGNIVEILNNCFDLLPDKEYKIFNRRCLQALPPKEGVEEAKGRKPKSSFLKKGRRRKTVLEAFFPLREKEDLFSLEEEDLFSNDARYFYIVRQELELVFQSSLRSFPRENSSEFIELQSSLDLNKTEADLLRFGFVFE